MTPPANGDLLLEAALACRTNQTELTASMSRIEATLGRLEVAAGTIAGAASMTSRLTWKGGVIALILWLAPALLPSVLLLLLLGRGGDLAALIHGQ